MMRNIAVSEIYFSQEETTSANKILQKCMEFFVCGVGGGGVIAYSTSAESPLKLMLSHDSTGLHQDEETSV